jgi:hypothetical protein
VEYAADVYLAADDVAMALHHCSLVASLLENDPASERRWAGAYHKGKVLALSGELQAAKDGLIWALQLAETYHDPLGGRVNTLAELAAVLLLMGDSPAYKSIAGQSLDSRTIPSGEHLSQDCRWDYRDAVAACCDGRFDQAIELLVKWDTKLSRDNVAGEWFECRLRLIAAHRLAGEQETVDNLAQPLFKRAQKARDWITLRRLRRLVDPTEPAAPTAMLASPRVGPFAPAGVTVPANVPVEASGSGSGVQGAAIIREGPPPLHAVFEGMVERLQSSDGDGAKPEILHQILTMSPTALTDPRDSASFLHLVLFLLADTAPFDEIWAWVQQAAAPFLQTSYVVNLGFQDGRENRREAHRGAHAPIPRSRSE